MASRFQYLGDPCGDRLNSFQLTDDADLHVINQQGQPGRIADILQCLRNRYAENLFHRVSSLSSSTARPTTGAATTCSLMSDLSAVAQRAKAEGKSIIVPWLYGLLRL